jgi:hypothetical protein
MNERGWDCQMSGMTLYARPKIRDDVRVNRRFDVIVDVRANIE